MLAAFFVGPVVSATVDGATLNWFVAACFAAIFSPKVTGLAANATGLIPPSTVTGAAAVVAAVVPAALAAAASVCDWIGVALVTPATVRALAASGSAALAVCEYQGIPVPDVLV